MYDVWDNCIEMWRWIVQQLDDEEYPDGCDDMWDIVHPLKQDYLIEMGLYHDIYSNCYFCDAAHDEEEGDFESFKEMCVRCPARAIDKNFDCFHPKYSYSDRPRAFLEKLEEMYKIVLEKR